MIQFSSFNKVKAIDTLDQLCKTFLTHGMSKPQYHKIEMLLHWMRQQKDDLYVSAKVSATDSLVHFEVVASFVATARPDAQAN